MQPSHWLYSQPYLRPVSPTDREEPGQFSLKFSLSYIQPSISHFEAILCSQPPKLKTCFIPHPSPLIPWICSAKQGTFFSATHIHPFLSDSTVMLSSRYLYNERKNKQKSNKKRKMYKDNITNMQTKWWQVVTTLISTKGQFIAKKKKKEELDSKIQNEEKIV